MFNPPCFKIPSQICDRVATNSKILSIFCVSLKPGVNNLIERNFSIMTSRGCPYFCTFCSSHSVHGRKMRYHSVSRMKDIFFHLKKKYDAKTLIFQDDCLMADKDRVYKLLNI